MDPGKLQVKGECIMYGAVKKSISRGAARGGTRLMIET